MNDKDNYIAEVTEYGRWSEKGDSRKVNAAYDRIKAALAKLRTSADSGEVVLLELLDHPNGWVRLFAATDLLPLRADRASPILEDLVSGPPGELRFDARMVLQEWRAGRLKVP